MKSDILLLFLGEGLVKSAALLLIGAVIIQVWRASSAAQRHFLWLAAMVALLLLPMTHLVKPLWTLPVERPAKVSLPPVTMSSVVLMAPMTVAATRDPRPPASTWKLPDWRSILLGAWFGGVVGLIGYRLLGSWRLRQLEKRSTPLKDTRVMGLTLNVLAEMQINREVNVRVSDECRVPVTWGIWRSVLLLPREALDWTDAQVTAALRHEAGHIHRRDYPARWIAHLACALYWPNPLVWLAARSLRIAQEQATDDLVLRAGTPPEEYATQLFQAARIVAAHGLFARDAVAMATPSTLENRVSAIVDEHRNRCPLNAAATVMGLCVAAFSLAICTAAQLQGADGTPGTSVTPESSTRAGGQVVIQTRFVEFRVDSSDKRQRQLVDRRVYSDREFTELLRALDQQRGIDVLLAPSLTAHSQQPAAVEVIREFPFPTDWENGAAGAWEPKEFETKKVGATLDVTPEIKPDGSIALHLKPSMVEFLGFIDLDDPKNSAATKDPAKAAAEQLLPEDSGARTGKRLKPIFSEQRLESDVTLKSGETVVLAGFQAGAASKASGKKIAGRKLVLLVTAKSSESSDASPSPSQGQDTNQVPPALDPRSQQMIREQATRVAEMENHLQLLNQLRPEEIQVALRALKIDDPTVSRTLPLLQDATVERARLVGSGLESDHPKVKALDAQRAAYAQILGDQLNSLRQAQSAQVRWNRDRLSALQAEAEPTRAEARKDAARPGPDTAAKTGAVKTATATERAAKIIIPKMEFREATLRESVDFLRHKSRELSPDGQEVNFVLNLPPGDSPTITLLLTNIPLLEAARYVAGLGHLDFSAQPNALVLGKLQPAIDVSEAAGSAALAKAQAIVIPKFELREATIAEAVHFLRTKAQELDPDKRGVNLILKPGPGTDAKVTLAMSNASLAEALRYVASLAGLELIADPEALLLRPPEEAAKAKSK